MCVRASVCVGSNSFQPPFFSDEYVITKIVFHDFIFISYVTVHFPLEVVCLFNSSSFIGYLVIFCFISEF